MNTKLMEEINPVFTTAQACLLVMAEAGDPDAKELAAALGFNRGISGIGRDALTEMEKFQRMKAIPGFSTMIEARFTATSNLIRSLPMKEIADLPCGYTPRGLQFARDGIHYCGIDLPVVAEAMASACEKLNMKSLADMYHPADATNYETLRRAADGCGSELLITTEGLLMYLTQSELEETFHNIHRLLSEFGGVWITTDNMIAETQARLIRVIDRRGTPDKADAGPGRPENSFFDPGQADAFVGRMGFSLDKVPVFDYLPSTLNTLANLPAEIRREAKEVFRQMYFWLMRVNTTERTAPERGQRFSALPRWEGQTLHIELKGRLDTMTAPELLTLFREETAGKEWEKIRINMSDLDYISSAGLRILLIMMKEKPENGSVTLCNLKPNVREILEATGFDQFFLKQVQQDCGMVKL